MNTILKITLATALVWGFALQGGAAESAGAVADTTPQTVGNPKRVVIARIGGDDEVTVEDFIKYISRSSELLMSVREQNKKIGVVKEMITQRLFDRAAKDEGLLKSKGASPTQQELIEAQSKLKQRHFPLPPPPSEKKLREYYDANQEKFGIPRMVRITQIQFRAPRKPTEEQIAEVRAKAEAALKRLEAGEELEEVAIVTENQLAREKKGDLGFLPLGADPWLDQAVASIGKGQHTGVLKSPVGYEILAVTDMNKPIIVPFDKVKGPVLEQLRKTQQTRARSQYAHKLAKKYNVEILQEAFKEAMP